jgi:DnaJ like chaperone protein
MAATCPGLAALIRPRTKLMLDRRLGQRPSAVASPSELTATMPWRTIWKALGAPDGGTLDGLVNAIRTALGLGPRAAVDRAAFTAAVVALSAKLSKSDGVALRIEEETFERLFRFEEGEAANIRWLFQLAAQDAAGFETYAQQVAHALFDRPGLKGDVLEALLHIASADGVLHPAEDRYLATVSRIFGYTASEYRAIRARFVLDPADPYEVLGASRATRDADLKARYRELVRQNHPDALAGRGLSKELQDLAQRKLAAINAAWDEIAGERGL